LNLKENDRHGSSTEKTPLIRVIHSLFDAPQIGIIRQVGDEDLRGSRQTCCQLLQPVRAASHQQKAIALVESRFANTAPMLLEVPATSASGPNVLIFSPRIQIFQKLATNCTNSTNCLLGEVFLCTLRVFVV